MISPESAASEPKPPQTNNGAPTESEAPPVEPIAPPPPILVIDVGGTTVKFLAAGHTEPRKARSGKKLTPNRLVDLIRDQTRDWHFESITLGYPGLVGARGPRSEPGNLGPGWVGFDFQAAFEKPVKVVNDAAMQAIGSYEGGRMLFLGLGTGLGSTLIAGHVIVQLELGNLQYNKQYKLGEVVNRTGCRRLGKRRWRAAVNESVTLLLHAFVVDYVVIGGGLAKRLKDLPPSVRLGHNLTAFRGGIRLWNAKDAWEMALAGGDFTEKDIRLV